MKHRRPIITQDVEQQELCWITQVQKATQHTSQFQAGHLQLNLQLNDQQVLKCRGQITGEYPIYLPDNQPFTRKPVLQAHFTISTEVLASQWQR